MLNVLSVVLIVLSAFIVIYSLNYGVAELIIESCFYILAFLLKSLEIPQDQGGWFYNYQTTLAAIVTVGSIWLTWHLYRRSQKSKEFSSRALMIEPLAAICDYARSCFGAVYSNAGTKPADNCSAKVEQLGRLVENIDRKTAQTVHALISFYQVHNSRLSDYYRNDVVKTVTYREEMLYDSIKLRVLASRLFDYARERDRYEQEVKFLEHKELTLSEIESGLTHIVGFNKIVMAHQDPSLEQLRQLIAGKHTEQNT